MVRAAAGILIATLAVYVWGFVFWGASALPYSALRQVEDEARVAALIRQHFPRDGTYTIPGRGGDPRAAARAFEEGPVAFVHLTARDGRPLMDPAIMAGGLALYLLVACVLYALLRLAGLPEYRKRVGFAVLVGLAGSLAITVGDAVWWQIDAGWKGWQALYDVASFLIMGLVLGAFTAPDAAPHR